MKDPFVEEIHKIREAWAKIFDLDLDAIYQDLKRKEQKHKDRIVSPGKRKAKKAV